MLRLSVFGLLLLTVGCASGSSPSIKTDVHQSLVQPAASHQPAASKQAGASDQGSSSNQSAGSQQPDSASLSKVDAVPKEIAVKIPILMYHSISDNPKNLLCLSPAKFAEQMQHLKDAGYHPITFQDLDDWKTGLPIPVKPVLITLDDGYRDNYTDAYPILKRLNLKATIFLVTGFLNEKQNLTVDMTKEMLASGLIQFGSHSISHSDLSTLPDERLRSEIFQSKQALESKLGVPITSFCYPSGRFNDKTLAYVKEAGYHFAVTTKPGWSELSQGEYTLHRVRINGDLTLQQFDQMLP